MLLQLTAFSLTALLAAAAGVWFTGLARWSRRILFFSGAILVLLSIVWVLPELASEFGPLGGVVLLTGSALLVWFIDKKVYPICPTCSPEHGHHLCQTPLHGFGTPLTVASTLHSLFDGWALLAGAGHALAAGVVIHKIPEALAFGVILRASLRSRRKALGWAAAAQSATLVGGLLYILLAGRIEGWSISLLLALGGGIFFYLGLHSLHGAWKGATRKSSAASDASLSPSETLSRPIRSGSR